VEERQAHTIVAAVPIDVSLTAERLTEHGRAAMEDQLGTEQPMEPLALAELIGTGITEQSPAGLVCLNRGTGRHAAARVATPTAGADCPAERVVGVPLGKQEPLMDFCLERQEFLMSCGDLSIDVAGHRQRRPGVCRGRYGCRWCLGGYARQRWRTRHCLRGGAFHD
jgi:hypothetical protein